MSDVVDPLDSLPSAILADVLGRVADAGDIAASRLASRALLAASYQCPRVRLSAAARARRLRGRGGGDGATAFRLAAANVASLLGPHLRSLALDASQGHGCPDQAIWAKHVEFDDANDLHLTSGESVAAWAATAAGPALREVDIADFWPQSCWRKAEALPVISRLCHNLSTLRLRKAWLSVDGLRIMPNLTHLALESIRLDDENLSTLNECFPCLHTLNLIGVGGLKNPKIHLPQLTKCHWEVSDVPRSLAIHAPNLVYLELKCVRPGILILNTPSVSTLKLTIDKLGPTVQVDGLVNLKNLRIESSDLNSLLRLFSESRDVRTLDLELPAFAGRNELYEAVEPELFSRATEVKLSPRFSYELMRRIVFSMISYDCRSCLRKLLVHMPPSILTTCPFIPLVNNCAPSCEVTVLFHADSSDATRQAAASSWPLRFPEITWQWGTWQ
ncbi:F-box/LRR-repeat protein At4g29420-like [Triticum dicoccoides]|uniref:F-box/LRR-repeat protein At4g29420-like n=1 Tax=Triticum dicoccoides TaxID=85692 RepID=UPI000E7930D5|nr:F-box/LRR-repeat protein At4g29420-like [Triticum dicoccoides]